MYQGEGLENNMYYVDPTVISQTERIHNDGEEKSFKLLGVLFDEYLSLDAYISLVYTKISKNRFSA
jgi:hypothetical protein